MITRRLVLGAAGATLAAPSLRAEGAWPDKPLRFIEAVKPGFFKRLFGGK